MLSVKDDPYPSHTGQLWGISSKSNFGEIDCYNGLELYLLLVWLPARWALRRLVTTSGMQQCFSVVTNVYRLFLISVHYYNFCQNWNLLLWLLNPFFRPPNVIGQLVSHDVLLGRWRLSLDLFGRVFCDDVGAEPGSVISELGGFPVKESRFRREMEKLRNSQQRDLSLEVGN